MTRLLHAAMAILNVYVDHTLSDGIIHLGYFVVGPFHTQMIETFVVYILNDVEYVQHGDDQSKRRRRFLLCGFRLFFSQQSKSPRRGFFGPFPVHRFVIVR